MDWTAIVEAVAIPLGGIGTVAWYGYTKMASRVTKAEERAANFELYCARTFVTNHAMETAISNFNRAVDAIFQKLEKIDDKLDKKADRQ